MKTRIGIHFFHGVTAMLMLVVLMCGAVGVLYFASVGNADDGALLAGNHPIEAETAHQLGEADPAQPLELQIRFALRHRAALARLLTQQHDPTSSNYRRWLTPDEFQRRFGPSRGQVNAVADWLAGQGFTVTRQDSNTVSFTGPVAAAESAFAVRIARFGDGSVYANTTDPVVPKRFATLIASVQGLDNMVRAVPMNAHSEQLVAMPDAIVNGSEAFGPADLRNFYDETVGNGRDGTGSCIAIVGVSDFVDSTMTTFTSQFGLPTISYTRVQHGSYPGLNSAAEEAELDLQWAHVAAPGASIVYHLGSDLVSDIAGAVNDNQCGVISISYGLCGVSASYMTSVMDVIFAQAAAQGESVFISSGDQGAAGITLNSSATACVVGSSKNVNEMSADPNVTSVGGTQFVPTFVNGIDVGYATEKVWNDASGATGGGVSQVFAKPSYQNLVGIPQDAMRDVPDVSLIASPNSPGVYFADYNSGGVVCCIGGTSLSAPVWAGFATVIGQIAGQRRLGNFNRIIYPLAPTQYGTAFHDVSDGNNNFNNVIGYSAGPGFDLATGWGSIDFNNFASAVQSYLSPTPTPTSTPTRTPSATPTMARTTTPTATATPSRTITPTPIAPRTATITPIATPAPTRTMTPTPTIAVTPSRTGTPTMTLTPTPIPSASVSPAVLDFGPSNVVGKMSILVLQIHNAYGSPLLSFTIPALSSPFAVYYPGSFRISAGATYQLPIAFVPTQAGTANSQLQITTNDPNNPTFTIPITGGGIVLPTPTPTPTMTITPTRTATATATPIPTPTLTATPTPTAIPTPLPSVSVTPTSMNFGSVGVGKSSTLVLLIHNAYGGAILSINVAAPNLPFYAYVPGNYRVAPGGTLQLPVYVVPTQTGAVGGQVQITTNDPSNPMITIPLTALGF